METSTECTSSYGRECDNRWDVVQVTNLDEQKRIDWFEKNYKGKKRDEYWKDGVDAISGVHGFE